MTQPTDGSAALRAGAAQVDITPDAGTHLSGDVGVHRPAKLVGEPLFAKALVLEAAGRMICFLALDVTIISEDYTAAIRRSAHQRFGIEPDALMVHATQTHSAPGIGPFMLDPEFPAPAPEFEWVSGHEEAYSSRAVAGAVEAVGRAVDALEPVQIGAGSGIEGRMAFNRRAVARDGKVFMPGPRWEQPLGPTRIRYIEGPIDPELGVVCIRPASMRPSAMLVNYTCHPVHVFPKPIVSPDWPGALADELRRAHGDQCVPVVLNGACGNINPWPPFDPDYVEDHRRMGQVLAGVAQDVLETLDFADEAVLDRRVRDLPLPLREVDPTELEWAKGILADSPQPSWAEDGRRLAPPDWMTAASIYSVHLMRERSEVLSYEVQVLRVGDAAFVGLPGEPFVECGLQIKLASPTYPTYIAHCTSHYVGYIPTPDALARGGHEVNTRYWAKLAPEAFDMIVAAATELLDEVFEN